MAYINCPVNSMHHVIAVTVCLNFLFGDKIIHFVDRTDLLKSNNLVSCGKAIVTSLYSSLEGQRGRERKQLDSCSGLYEFWYGKQHYLYDRR